MSDYITITGVKPYDGRHELDLTGQALTTREWGWAKRYANVLPLTIDRDTFADPEMVSVLAIIALHRNHKIEPSDVPDLWERFQDAPFGDTIRWEAGAEEADDTSPPPQSSDARPSSNGDDSTMSTDPSENPPSPTGHRRSDTSVSVPVTSAT